MSPPRNAFILWLWVLAAPAVLAAETAAPPPPAANASPPADLYLIAEGTRSAHSEHYLDTLCKLLSKDPHGRRRFRSARILRNNTQDLMNIRKDLSSQLEGMPSQAATDLGVLLDELKRGSVDCLARSARPPAEPPPASEVPDTERPSLIVLAESFGEKAKDEALSADDKVDQVRLRRFLLDPGAPPGTRRRLELPTFVEGADADELARKMGVAMLDLPQESLFQATFTVEGDPFLPCTTPTSACVLPGSTAKLVLEVRDTAWLKARDVSASLRAHCDTADQERLSKSLPPIPGRPDDTTSLKRVEGTGQWQGALHQRFMGVGSCTFEADLSESTGQHTGVVSGGRLEVKALSVLAGFSEYQHGWRSPSRMDVLLMQRKLASSVPIAITRHPDPKQFELTKLRRVSAGELLLFGQRVREAILRVEVPSEIPELTAMLDGLKAQVLESYHDGLGYLMLHDQTHPDGDALLPDVCSLLTEVMTDAVRARQVSSQYLQPWKASCDRARSEAERELGRTLEQREAPALRISRLPGKEHFPHWTIQNLKGTPAVEVKLEELQFNQRPGVEEQYLVSGKADADEVIRPLQLQVESDPGPANFEFGIFLQFDPPENPLRLLPRRPGFEFAVPLLDRALLATSSWEIFLNQDDGATAGSNAAVTTSVSVDVLRLSALLGKSELYDLPIALSPGVGYDHHRRSPVFTMGFSILVPFSVTPHFRRPLDGLRIGFSSHTYGNGVTFYRLGVLFF